MGFRRKVLWALEEKGVKFVMKLLRFEVDQKQYQGVLKDNKIYVDQEEYSLEEVKFLPPCLPSKAVCVGLNYHDHAKEMNIPLPNQPVIFIKPSTSIIAHKDTIVYPSLTRQVDYECELAVVIKKTAKNISKEEAKDYILGYTCANDVTARDLQKPGEQWTTCKSFDTFLPIGPVIETDINPHIQEINTYVNGEIKQHSNTKNLIFDIYYLVSYISQIMTLLPGDIILTGTPGGIGPLLPGDEVKVEIEGIGILVNYVK